MSLNFTNQSYFEKALALAAEMPESHCTVPEAFLLLIRGAGQGQLSNLLRLMCEKGLAEDEAAAHELTQDCASNDARASELLALAYACLDAGLPLGEETLAGGKINTSHYMGHSLLEGRLCGNLAARCGLDRDYAQCLGILHDYGRREVHTLMHTIRGFELLVDQGYDAQALGCLTHSFLGGGRCASNEQAEQGFYVDPEGNPCWTPDAERDEMTVFLDRYSYTDYDFLLNIADLMATSTAVVSPSERIADIATRRTLDPVNRGYFLAELTNSLNRLRLRIAPETVQAPLQELKAAAGISLEQITAAFESASSSFYSCL